MALCLIDAIWSMGVRYQGVVNVLNRYRYWLGASDRGSPARSATDLIDDIASAGGPEAFAAVVNNVGEPRPGTASSSLRLSSRLPKTL